MTTESTTELVPEPTTPLDPTTDAASADSETHNSVQTAGLSFADYGIRPEIVAALAGAGITEPFPIQAMTLPVALAGQDIIGQAKTGTGKTLGFGVPLLHRVIAPGEPGYDTLAAPGKPQAVVVVPTRELASQVAGDLATASSTRSVRILQVYGGRAYEPQVNALAAGVDVVVGTPGRMIDLLNQGHLSLKHAGEVVLDEADEMLDLGFLPDVERILSSTPATRHTMLFSATMPGAVVAMARRYMTQPTHIRANDPDDSGATVKNTKQVVYRAHALDKVEVLARLLQAEGRGLTIVFARTKRTAAKVADDLAERGFAAASIHGDLGQGAREQALRAFRNGKVDVLVATDVAARGIDVEDVTHVVNYQCPEDEKTYLHRIGRTGRAGASGTAVTFVDWDDIPRWGLIDKTLELGIPDPVETYSTSAHLFSDLHIPAGTTGRLPRAARTRAGLDAETLEDLGETGKHTTRVAQHPDRRGSAGGGRGSSSRGERGGRSDGGRGDSTRSDGGRSEGGRGGRDGQRPRRDAAAGDATAATESGAPVTAAGTGDAPASERSGAPRRRRRRRGGSGSGGADSSGASSSGASTSSAPAAD